MGLIGALPAGAAIFSKGFWNFLEGTRRGFGEVTGGSVGGSVVDILRWTILVVCRFGV